VGGTASYWVYFLLGGALFYPKEASPVTSKTRVSLSCAHLACFCAGDQWRPCFFSDDFSKKLLYFLDPSSCYRLSFDLSPFFLLRLKNRNLNLGRTLDFVNGVSPSPFPCPRVPGLSIPPHTFLLKLQPILFLPYCEVGGGGNDLRLPSSAVLLSPLY